MVNIPKSHIKTNDNVSFIVINSVCAAVCSDLWHFKNVTNGATLIIVWIWPSLKHHIFIIIYITKTEDRCEFCTVIENCKLNVYVQKKVRSEFHGQSIFYKILNEKANMLIAKFNGRILKYHILFSNIIETFLSFTLLISNHMLSKSSQRSHSKSNVHLFV